jgi:hypothetical protein
MVINYFVIDDIAWDITEMAVIVNCW